MDTLSCCDNLDILRHFAMGGLNFEAKKTEPDFLRQKPPVKSLDLFDINTMLGKGSFFEDMIMKKLVIFLSYLFVVLLAVTLHYLSGKPCRGNSPRLINCSLKPLPASSRHHINAAPHIRIREGTSLNWSGYAAVAGTLASPQTDAVAAVAGRWGVPKVTGSAGQYSALWVGIDGYADGTVEQIGTEQDVVYVRQGRKVVAAQQNYTWFEMYPSYAYEIVGFPTGVGDVIGAGVTYVKGGVFVLAITNLTRNVYFVVPTSYTTLSAAKRSSAEWVAEAPSSYSGTLPLANFGTVAFIDCTATINGTAGPISGFTYDPLTMETLTGTVKAAPSALMDNGSSFAVTWHHQ
jgi:hypothetical protein